MATNLYNLTESLVQQSEHQIVEEHILLISRMTARTVSGSDEIHLVRLLQSFEHFVDQSDDCQDCLGV